MNDVIFEAKKEETGCQCNCYCKIWRQGHSFKCKDKEGKRVATAIRYWKPEPSLLHSFYEHCSCCSHVDESRLAKMKENLSIVSK